MANIFLTDSEEEAIVDFVKNQEKLYDKIDKLCNKKTGRIVSGKFLPGDENSLYKPTRHGSSPKACYGKLTQSKSGEASKELSERQPWI